MTDLSVVLVVQSLSHVQLFVTSWTAAHQASLSFTVSWSLLNSCPLSWWCHPTISSSVALFSLHPQSFPASGFFPMSQYFASGGQSIVASASASIFPVNIQGWFPLGLTGSVSLQSKGLSRVFSSTTKASVLQPTKKAEHQRIDLSVASYTNQQQGICLIVKWQSMIVEGTKI